MVHHISHSWLIILGSFFLVGSVGGLGGYAHPAHLVEDMSGVEADTPTKFQPDPSNDCAVHALHTDRQTDRQTHTVTGQVLEMPTHLKSIQYRVIGCKGDDGSQKKWKKFSKYLCCRMVLIFFIYWREPQTYLLWRKYIGMYRSYAM